MNHNQFPKLQNLDSIHSTNWISIYYVCVADTIYSQIKGGRAK